MRSKKGFTLVEVLVAMFIFTIAMVAISEIFVSFIKSYRTARVMQKDLQDAQQASNYISKTLRTSTVMSGDDKGKIIVIYDYSQGKCIEYSFAEDGLFMKIASPDPDEAEKEPVGDKACEKSIFLSSESAKLIDGEVIEEGKFVRSISSAYEGEEISNDARVGIVTVLISLKTGHGAPLNIQTSASLRDYEKTVDPKDLGGESTEEDPPKVKIFNINCTSGNGESATILKIEADDEGTEASGIAGYAIRDFAKTDDNIEFPGLDSDEWYDKPEDLYGEYWASVEGERKLILFVKDKSGNIGSLGSSLASCVFKAPDETSPVVTSFTTDSPIESDSLNNVLGMKITATDESASAVACKITREGEAEPTKTTPGWVSCDSVSYTFPKYDEEYTLYPWAKDATGNVSQKSLTHAKKVTIIKPDKEPPKIDAFEVSSTLYSMNVKIDKIAASDDASGVDSYCIKEGSATDTTSSYSDCKWNSWTKGADEINDVTYEVKTEGIKTLFVWVKDGKEKISETTSISRKIVAVWNYVSGPCEGFLVRGMDTAQEEWATGSGYTNPAAWFGINEEHCVAPQCSGDPGITSPINSDSVKFSWTSPTVGSLDARQACKNVNGILPNRTQLQCIQKHKDIYKGIGLGNYWTSEEIKGECVSRMFLFSDCDYARAYQINMTTGDEVTNTNKRTPSGVRCILPTL